MGDVRAGVRAGEHDPHRGETIHDAGEVAALEWRDPLGLRGCGFFTVRNGRIVFQRGYWDKLSFLKMHGLPIA